MKNIKKISINYDKDADVLYISFGKARPAVSIELEEGTLVRIDPFTQQIVGITIIDFAHKHMQKEKKNVKDTVTKIVPRILDDYKTYLKENQIH
jgi:uncharacterized protein YuzE